jgi:hypothetical protein
MSKSCCKKVGKKLSGVEISAIVVGSVSGAAGLAVGAYFLYKYLEKKGNLPWQKASRFSFRSACGMAVDTPLHPLCRAAQMNLKSRLLSMMASCRLLSSAQLRPKPLMPGRS